MQYKLFTIGCAALTVTSQLALNVPAVTVIVALPAPTAFTVALLPSPVTVATFYHQIPF